MIYPTPIAPAWILALVSTIHVALVALRHARGASPRWLLPPMLLVSAVWTVAPWMFPSSGGVALGLAGHMLWFVACDRFARTPPLPSVRPPSAPPPSVGVVRSIAASASAPADAPAALSPAAPARRAPDFSPSPVVAVLEETPSIRTFRLARPEGFSFAAGQFVPVQVQVDGKRQVRCYSISSPPEATGYLDITVRRQGLVSGTLHSTLRPGATVLVKPPAGRFVYPEGDYRPIVLVGGGVGVTPLMSMLRHAVLAEPSRPVSLLLSVRSADDVPFHDELMGLPSRHPHARVTVTITGAYGHSNGFKTGRITAAMLRDHVAVPEDAIYLLCGPVPMIKDLRAQIEALGVPPGQVRSEVFQAGPAIGAVASPVDLPAPAVLPTPVVQAADPDTARLVCSRSHRTVDVPSGVTLLEAAEQVGVSIPSLCRAGVCGTCRTRVLSGRTRCTSDGLGAADREAGFVLPCVSWPEGDCTLDA